MLLHEDQTGSQVPGKTNVLLMVSASVLYRSKAEWVTRWQEVSKKTKKESEVFWLLGFNNFGHADLSILKQIYIKFTLIF
jgi:hypothetical protein